MRLQSSFAIWLFLFAILAFLYAPLAPPLLMALHPSGADTVSIKPFIDIWADQMVVGALVNSAILALIVGIAAPLLALAAAQALRRFGASRLIITVMIIPLFVPGVSMGLSTSLFLAATGISPSLLSAAVIQILWALPFAFLIVLTVMAGFDTIYLEAAHTCGAGPLQAFWEIELPQIAPGLRGAAIFSVILSVNETVRTAVVQGGNNTIPTFIWSRYLQVGLSPNIYALMALIIVTTLLLVVILAVTYREPESRPIAVGKEHV